jgi:hypothetical protein
MNATALDRASADLDDYIRFRAVKQGVGYALSLEFFRHALRTGCRKFFNVTVGKDGRLMRDTEYPRWFEEWKQERATE